MGPSPSCSRSSYNLQNVVSNEQSPEEDHIQTDAQAISSFQWADVVVIPGN